MTARLTAMLALSCVLASAAGCTMCCHPYDYCGPVFQGSTCSPVCSNVRAGSILEGGAPANYSARETVPAELKPTPAPTRAAAVAPSDSYDDDDSPSVISESDRRSGHPVFYRRR